MTIFAKFTSIFIAAAFTLTSTIAAAHHRPNHNQGGSDPVVEDDPVIVDDDVVLTQPKLQAWMNPEIAAAWIHFQGQGTQITVIDDFKSNWGLYGDLGTGRLLLRHGEWTSLQASMIAPLANIVNRDWNTGSRVSLASGQLNTLNLSYGMMAKDGYTSVNWGRQESSIISYAKDGKAVVVKAAGNDNVAVGAVNGSGNVDYLNRDLIGTYALFVGALDQNGTNITGTDGGDAIKASYSNFAGTDTRVQDRFLMVGVHGDLTGLYGTSFAAPVVSGYAAVLGSKWTAATPIQIANQLLITARTDTISSYSRSIHGVGEASITRALAPSAILQ
jgi:subtilisin family serine protease